MRIRLERAIKKKIIIIISTIIIKPVTLWMNELHIGKTGKFCVEVSASYWESRGEKKNT